MSTDIAQRLRIGIEAGAIDLADIMDAADEIERLRDATHSTSWIAVGERLPEEDRLVLWYRPDGRWPVTAGRFERPHHVDEGGDLCVPFSEGRYTHWLPLPPPPEANQ